MTFYALIFLSILPGETRQKNIENSKHKKRPFIFYNHFLKNI